MPAGAPFADSAPSFYPIALRRPRWRRAFTIRGRAFIQTPRKAARVRSDRAGRAGRVAEGGHLEVIKWALEHGCPCPKVTELRRRVPKHIAAYISTVV